MHVISGNILLSQSLLCGDWSSVRNSVNRLVMAALQDTMNEEADDIHTEVRTRLKKEEIYNLIHNYYYYLLEGLATYMQDKI